MRFFFDIQEGKTFTRDAQGLELSNLSAAIEEARATAISMSHEAFTSHVDKVVVQVRDTGGRLKATASVILSVG